MEVQCDDRPPAELLASLERELLAGQALRRNIPDFAEAPKLTIFVFQIIPLS